jgi:hypothetical protein
MKEDKLKLRSLRYEKDRWLLQGELGDHGFEIAIREMAVPVIGVVASPSFAADHSSQVIRHFGRRESIPVSELFNEKSRPPLLPPLISELEKVWPLR